MHAGAGLAVKEFTAPPSSSKRSVQAQPLAGGALRLGDLLGRHFDGDLLPMHRRLIATGDRSEVEPFVGRDEVNRHLATGCIENAELEESLRVRLGFSQWRELRAGHLITSHRFRFPIVGTGICPAGALVTGAILLQRL